MYLVKLSKKADKDKNYRVLFKAYKYSAQISI